MRKSSILLFTILLIFLLVQCNRKEESRLHERLTQMATALNESAPVMLDRYTRFEEASVTDENHFRYRYTVLNTAKP